MNDELSPITSPGSTGSLGLSGLSVASKNPNYIVNDANCNVNDANNANDDRKEEFLDLEDLSAPTLSGWTSLQQIEDETAKCHAVARFELTRAAVRGRRGEEARAPAVISRLKRELKRRERRLRDLRAHRAIDDRFILLANECKEYFQLRSHDKDFAPQPKDGEDEEDGEA